MEEKHIGHLIIRTANILRRCTLHDMSHSPGSTAVQNFFLGYLYRAQREGKPLYQRDLEKEFSLRRSTASGILAVLEQNGFIRREACATDARMKTIILTPKALGACDAEKEKIDAFEKNLVSNFTPRELSMLENMLLRVCENARQSSEAIKNGREGNVEC